MGYLDCNWCAFDNKGYYSDEVISLSCKITNIGTVFLSDLSICLDLDCIHTNIGIGETKTFNYNIAAREQALFIVENENFIKKENLKFTVYYIPDIYVTSLEPSSIDYDVDADVQFFLQSDVEVYDVNVNINDLWNVNYENLSGKEFVTFNANSRDLISGLNLEFTFKDSTGKEYQEEKNYPLIVKNIPFYAKFWSLISDLF